MALSIKNQQKKLPIAKEVIKRIAKRILSNYGISRYKICIAFLDNEAIQELNKKFLDRDCPTDVLTFPYQTASVRARDMLEADIAISSEAAIENSHRFKTTVKKELLLYIIHGLLHLLDFNDKRKNQREIMEAEEQCWLLKLKREIKHI